MRPVFIRLDQKTQQSWDCARNAVDVFAPCAFDEFHALHFLQLISAMHARLITLLQKGKRSGPITIGVKQTVASRKPLRIVQTQAVAPRGCLLLLQDREPSSSL